MVEWPQSWVKQHAVNLDYAWKPEDNQCLDLKASLWTTLNDSRTNSAGGAPGDVLYYDRAYDDKYQVYYYANGGDPTLPDDRRAWFQLLNNMVNPDNIKPTSADSTTPNTDGRFNTIDGAAYYAKNNRVGFNLSNRMQLTSMLNLTLMGDFQYETLKSTNAYGSFFAYPNRYADEKYKDIVSPNIFVDHTGLPRNGKRQESDLAFKFTLTPTDWLIITAGARYSDYSIQDDYVKGFLETLDQSRPVRIDTGRKYNISRVLTEEEYNVYQQIQDAIYKYGNYYKEGTKEQLIYKYGEDYIKRIESAGVDDLKIGDEYRKIPTVGGAGSATWMKDKYGHYNMQDNPYLNGTFDMNAEVINPIDKKNIMKYVPAGGSTKGSSSAILMDERKRANAYKQTGHGWVPLASVSVFFTPNSRAYLRYSESLRYPGMFEGTLGFSNTHSSAPDYGRLGYLWKPEHAKNWEVGYVYSFAHLLPHTRYADFRVNYYHNTTENIIDRDTEYNFHQYDKQLLSGAEVQGRLDTGMMFGDQGVVRTIKDQICDSVAAFMDSWTARGYLSGEMRTPTCQNGGMTSNGYLTNMILPRWSVVANLSRRFFHEKPEIGTRFTYYSRVYDTRYKSLQGSGLPAPRIRDAALRWQPVAVYDAYVRYKFNKNLIAELTGNNLANLYYLDPMSRSYVPAPGKTIRISLAGRF